MLIFFTALNDDKTVIWYRKLTHGASEPIWIFIFRDLIVQGNAIYPGFVRNIVPSEQDEFTEFHKIILTSVTSDDDGEYWCVVQIEDWMNFEPLAHEPFEVKCE